MDQTQREIDNLLLKARISRRTMTAGVVAGVAVVAVAAGGYFYIMPQDSVPDEPPTKPETASRPAQPTTPTIRPTPVPTRPSTPTTTEPTPEPKEPEPVAELKPATVTLAIRDNIEQLNPLFTRRGGGDSPVIIFMLYESLTVGAPPMDDLTSSELVIYPHLASEIAPLDGKFQKIRLKVRGAVKFHDGTTMDAESVRTSIDAHNDKRSRLPYFRTVTNMVARDSKTLDIEYQENDIGNWQNILHNRMPYVFSKKALAGGIETLDKTPAGTGRYKLTEWEPGVKLVLERFEDYWGLNPLLEESVKNPLLMLGNITKLNLVRIQERTAQLVALRRGEIDGIGVIPTNSVLDAQKDPEINVAGVTAAGNYVWMNTLQGREGSVKAFGDKRVRQAINYAVDKEGIVRVFDNVHTVANGPSLPWHLAYDPNHKNYPFDQAKAKQLLADAGYKDGFGLNYWTSSNPETVIQGEVIRSNLTDVGLDVNFRVLGRSESFRITRSKNQTQVHMDTLNIGLKYDQELFDIFFTDRANRSHAPIPKIQELMDTARKTTDVAVQTKAYKEAAAYVFDEGFLVFPYWSSRFAVGKKGVLDPTMWPGENLWMPFLWNATKE